MAADSGGSGGDAAFFSLELSSSTAAPTTPALADDDRGLRIAAPAEVPLTGDVRVPVSAVARFDIDVRDTMPAMLWTFMTAVVTDEAGAVLVAKPLGEPDQVPEIDYDSIPTDPEVEGLEVVKFDVGTEYQNFDLLEVVDLPQTPGAAYFLHLTYGPHQSNSVQFRFVEP